MEKMNETKLAQEIRQNKNKINRKKKDMEEVVEQIKAEALEITITSNPQWMSQKITYFSELKQELSKLEGIKDLLNYLNEDK